MQCIIQARMNSKRLPGKVLKKILNKEILKLLIERLKKSRKISNIIVATSNKKSDTKIVNFCKKNRVEYFRGSLQNVTFRFLEILKKKKILYFLRICADSPLVDPLLIDKMINLSKKKYFDIFTNVFPRTFPSGQSIEIIKTSLLKKNIKNFDLNDKEHVTEYFYRNYKKFIILNYKNNIDLSKYKMSVDTQTDFKKLKKISIKLSINKLININYKKLLNYYK
jgi:spore coat polysaccharide biosynthesis protein SpsF